MAWRQGLTDLPLAGLLCAAVGVLCLATGKRWTKYLSANLADVPTIAAMLLLSPGLATLVAVVGVLPLRGSRGCLSRLLNVTFLGAPVLVGGLVFHELLNTFQLTSPYQGPLAWLLFAAIAVATNAAVHWTIASAWLSWLEGARFSDYVREVAIPVAKSDPLPAALTILLVEIAIVLPGESKVLPLLLAIAAGVGVWLFIRASQHQVAARELKDNFFRSIFTALARLLDMKDPDTAVHSARVARYSREIARCLGMSDEEQSRIHLAGLLHDVGKVGVPDWILHKPGRLSDPERAAMQRHSRLSAEAISGIPGFGDLTRMVYAHHERLDGSGYPDGVGGGDVPLGARIIGVADTFEALTSDRPYRKGRPAMEALAVIENEIHLFDPLVVGALRAALQGGQIKANPGAVVADFSHEWAKAAQYLDVRDDEEIFELPPERHNPLLDQLEPPVGDPERAADQRQ